MDFDELERQIPGLVFVSEDLIYPNILRTTWTGGTDQDIANYMHNNLPAYFRTVGDVSVEIEMGSMKFIYRFDRPKP